MDAAGLLWVTDACNHRVQVFDVSGAEAKLVRYWGQPGGEPGQLSYPYDLLLDGEGGAYLCEYGNHRVQRFSLAGELLGHWGRNGRDRANSINPGASPATPAAACTCSIATTTACNGFGCMAPFGGRNRNSCLPSDWRIATCTCFPRRICSLSLQSRIEAGLSNHLATGRPPRNPAVATACRAVSGGPGRRS